VIAIGEAAPLIDAALGRVLPVQRASSMDDAVRLAYAAAGTRGTVLLAPACSSFDMFRDYADRGRAFKEAVRSLSSEQSSVWEQR
jgi:UDP-N-acetylmuramoylalanine--D-glutamate ligase